MADLRFATSGLHLRAGAVEGGGLAVEAFALAPAPVHLSFRLAPLADPDARREFLREGAARLLKNLPKGQPWPAVGELTNALATLAGQVARG